MLVFIIDLSVSTQLWVNSNSHCDNLHEQYDTQVLCHLRSVCNKMGSFLGNTYRNVQYLFIVCLCSQNLNI